MRRLLRGLAGAPALSPLRNLRAAFYFAATRREAFDPTHLGSVDDAALASFFQDAAVSGEWDAEQRGIVEWLPAREILGGLNPGERRALYYFVRALRPQAVLEIGTHIGASTIHIARALAANGGGACLTTVDVADVNDGHDAPWREAGMVKSPRDVMGELGCASNVRFVVGSALAFMRHAADRYDLVFLDGDHRPHAVYQEIAAALRVLAPDGLVLLHDYYPGRAALYPDGRVIDGPVRAVERIMREEHRIEGRPLRSLPWPTKQGVNATSLALLMRSPA